MLMSTTKNEDVEKTEGKERVTEIQRDCADLRYEIRRIRSTHGSFPRRLHCTYHCSVIEYQNRLLPAVMETSDDDVLHLWGAHDRDDVKEYNIELTSGRRKCIQGLGTLGEFCNIKNRETVAKDDLINGQKTESVEYQDIIIMRMLTYIHDDLDIIAHRLGYGTPVEEDQTTYMLEVE